MKLLVLVLPGTRTVRSNPFEPDLPPVWINAPGTEHATPTVPSVAYNCIQDDARILHVLHLTGLLINDMSYALEYSVGATAIGHHFGIPVHTAVLTGLIQR